MIRNEVFARANSGDPKAQAQVAFEYYKERKLDQAYSWALRSAIKNNEQGLYLLGIFYWNGTGVQKNIDLGINYIKRSAKMGCVEAQNTLRKFNIPFENVNLAEPLLFDMGNGQLVRPDQSLGQGGGLGANMQELDEDEDAPKDGKPPKAKKMSKEEKQRQQRLLKEEKLREKRKKLRRRLKRRRQSRKFFGKLFLIIFLLIVVALLLIVAWNFIPISAQNKAWNTYIMTMWKSDITGTNTTETTTFEPHIATLGTIIELTPEQQAEMATPEGATKYLASYSYIFGIMLPPTVNEDGTASGKLFVAYTYSAAGDNSDAALQFGQRTINFVKSTDAEGNEIWKIADRDALLNGAPAEVPAETPAA